MMLLLACPWTAFYPELKSGLAARILRLQAANLSICYARPS
jgi:hypothetical protein